MDFSRRGFVRLVAAVAANLGISGRRAFAQEATRSSAVDPDSAMWLEQPSKVWMDAYPLGNGRLGAMVFGGVDSERLALNEDTLWWARGKVSGLRARGGLEVGMEWATATGTTATVRASVNASHRFRAPKGQVLRGMARNGAPMPLTANDGEAFTVACKPGETYRFVFGL